ncbi:aminotransferase class V-fold PLP-dependent enzyme [Desulfosporosinus sp.]|uniref:aminotransferase class V-fold PLP-dependent enzyme n=1 Tax=Desulfosporosinus sp. TaxID=157907 RepID=UPI0025C20A05|nr:aminotransferase class V-fold PLP-dependent enzyme [Desulfosporosinus sp.]MBC2724658.1 aminotransferase class V-fold PLP-dependent enzyme [Desulfosporosinus sp.]MBC2726979.1 aminotransferase class V-fold PLP-dependent enzyme [Desulfosporosinus sp.]
MEVYLDNAATTFPKPEVVIEAVADCMRNGAINAGRGAYPLARKADRLIEDTRYAVASLLNYKEGRVLLTASATLALNQVLLGISWSHGDVIYSTPFEHNSVSRVLQHLKDTSNIKLLTLPVNARTLEYDLDAIKQMFEKMPPKALVMTHVSNVCGLITPVSIIAEMAKSYEAIVVIDGAQAGPLLPLQKVQELVDYYIFSGHKTFYGPFGISGFVTNGNFPLTPIIFGGTGSHSELLSMPEELPFRHEVGSSNIVAIAGLYAGCGWLEETGIANIREHENALLKRTVEGLSEYQDIKLYISKNLENHLGTLSFTIDGYTAQEIGMILSQEFGISTRTGLHCAPMAHAFLGTSPHGTVRVGFGYFNSKVDVKCLIDAVRTILVD